MLKEQDDSRHRYVRTYFHSDLYNPAQYDITINTGRLGFVRSANLIANLALESEQAL
jgi:hypothetical protein